MLVETAVPDAPPRLLIRLPAEDRWRTLNRTDPRHSATCALRVTPSFALSAVAQHCAFSDAHGLAARQRLDHSGFCERVDVSSGPAAENVAYDCAMEDCVIRMWARSGAHRANAAPRCDPSYALALANGGQWQTLLGTGTRQVIQR